LLKYSIGKNYVLGEKERQGCNERQWKIYVYPKVQAMPFLYSVLNLIFAKQNHLFNKTANQQSKQTANILKKMLPRGPSKVFHSMHEQNSWD